jgi:hypothetical protein
MAWIILGRSGAVAKQTSEVLRSAKVALDKAVDVTAGPIGSTLAGAISHAGTAGAGVSDAISRVVHSAGTVIGEAVEGLNASGNKPHIQSEFTRHFPPPRSRRLVDLLDDQPLALGVLGVAVGAAIASAFSSTSAEARLMGTAAERLRETATDAAVMIADKVEFVIGEATDEALAQNLTPEALKEVVKAGAGKLKTVAHAGSNEMQK